MSHWISSDTPDQIETAHHREPPPPPPPPRRSDHPPAPPPRRSDHPPPPPPRLLLRVDGDRRTSTHHPHPHPHRLHLHLRVVSCVPRTARWETSRLRRRCSASLDQSPGTYASCLSSRPRARSISGTTRTRPTSRIRRFAPSRFSSRDTASTARRGFDGSLSVLPTQLAHASFAMYILSTYDATAKSTGPPAARSRPSPSRTSHSWNRSPRPSAASLQLFSRSRLTRSRSWRG